MDEQTQQRNIQDTPVMTKEKLATPQQDFEVVQTPPPTQGSGLLGELEANAAGFTQNLQQQAQQSQQASDSSFEDYLAGLSGTLGETELTSQAYSQEGGVDDIQQELNSINQELLSEQNALRRRIERIQDNNVGMSAQAIEDEVNRVERESLRKQADLSVIQMGIQGRFDSAKAIADRAIAVQLERDQSRNEALRLNYERNQNLFDKDEQRAFESAQRDRERALDAERERLKEISDLSLMAMQQGAPGYLTKQIREAGSIEQAQAIASDFLSPIIQQDRELDRAFKLAQINRIGLQNLIDQAKLETTESNQLTTQDIKDIDTSPQGKALKSMGDLKLKLSNYQKLVNEHGMEAFGENRAALENAYRELQLSYKEAANLGALQGPDIELVESAIKSATPGFFGTMGNVLTFGQGTRNLKTNLDQAQETLNTAANTNLEQLIARDARYGDSVYVSSLVAPFGDEILLNSEVNEMDAILNGE